MVMVYVKILVNSDYIELVKVIIMMGEFEGVEFIGKFVILDFNDFVMDCDKMYYYFI